MKVMVYVPWPDEQGPPNDWPREYVSTDDYEELRANVREHLRLPTPRTIVRLKQLVADE